MHVGVLHPMHRPPGDANRSLGFVIRCEGFAGDSYRGLPAVDFLYLRELGGKPNLRLKAAVKLDRFL